MWRVTVGAMLALSGCASGGGDVWRLDNLERVGGYRVTVVGDPKVIDTPGGKALEFDGIDDGIVLDVHPLAGMSEFTVEIVFKPYSEGKTEQRFFHMQEYASEQRVMFETRLTDSRWFLDTFIFSADKKVPLYAIENKHELDTWHHAAIVVDGESFRHYVNGELELDEPLSYQPQTSGRTSLGMRMNKVGWFKGAIRTVRFQPEALVPGDFLTAAD